MYTCIYARRAFGGLNHLTAGLNKYTDMLEKKTNRVTVHGKGIALPEVNGSFCSRRPLCERDAAENLGGKCSRRWWSPLIGVHSCYRLYLPPVRVCTSFSEGLKLMVVLALFKGHTVPSLLLYLTPPPVVSLLLFLEN